MSEEAVLELKFLGALVGHLGAQMYPSATATIAELISNAWDADASRPAPAPVLPACPARPALSCPATVPARP